MRTAIFFGLALALVFLSLPAQAAQTPPVTDEAQRIYGAYGDAIYQVQTIDLASNNKSSIGSGFQFTKDGLIATNYHVVAESIQRPGANKLEYLHGKNERGDLKILIADVVHDLAILRMDKPGKTWVELGTSTLPKGVKLFSLGNPHDIGFTIIEGTYNGKNEESFIDKIHFSGSLNPGMSGGPALGHNGKVVGINVSTAGNQISFLVPVEPLRELLLEYLSHEGKSDFLTNADSYLEKQLLDMQEKNVARMLEAKWESLPFGPFMVPGRVTKAFKCWGETDIQEKNQYRTYHSTCSSQDRLFIDEDSSSREEFYTGSYLYRFDSIVGEEDLNLSRFYSYYEDQYSYPIGTFTNGGESNVTNFDCNSSFVDLAGKRCKSSFCLRRYKKFPQLYDMHLYMALVGEGRQGLVATQALQGVSKDSALKLARRFMEEIKPNPAGAGGSSYAPSPALQPPAEAPPLDDGSGGTTGAVHGNAGAKEVLP